MPQFLDDAGKGRGEVVAGLQVEITAAGFVRHVLHGRIETGAFDPDAVDHEPFGHRTTLDGDIRVLDIPAGIGAVGENEKHAPARFVFERAHRLYAARHMGVAPPGQVSSSSTRVSSALSPVRCGLSATSSPKVPILSGPLAEAP